MRTSTDYPVLRRPRLVSGVGTRAATLLWAITFLIASAIGFPWGFVIVPVTGFIHAILSWLFRLDHKIFEIYAVYATYPDKYKAGYPSHGEKILSRPKGFGQGLSI